MNPELQAIYDQVPEIACERKCAPACSMIPIHPLERIEIAKYTGRKVKVCDTNWGMTYKNFLVMKAKTGSVVCRYFRRNKCSIYPVRPLICRFYGVTEGLRCPFGCEQEGMLTDKEAHELIKQLNEIEVPGAKRPRRKKPAPSTERS